MKSILVTFEDNNTISTNINGSNEEITAYYTKNYFNFGDTEQCPKDKLLKAVKVEFFYEIFFNGRTKGAIGIFYNITDTFKGENEQQARLNMYGKYDHIHVISVKQV